MYVYYNYVNYESFNDLIQILKKMRYNSIRQKNYDLHQFAYL